MKVLVVDDDRASRRTVLRVLQTMVDVEVQEATSIREARQKLDAGFDVALIDLRLSDRPKDRDGLVLVGEVRARGTVPLVVSGFGDLGEIRAAMRAGAYDFLLKDDLSEDLIHPVLESIRNHRAMERELLELRARHNPPPDGLIGTSVPIQRLRDRIRRVALSRRPVLVTGETGAGKELTVRAIHAFGAHPDAPLLDLNCGAFPAELVESQLFGHERGAFTGADRQHDGHFSAVRDGTLFLDEIGEMPNDLQAKLLRVIETATFRPLGSNTSKRFSGRIVAATHVDLEARVAAKQFRSDLFYRLNVLEIPVPALKERTEDIPALVAHFAAAQDRPLVFSAEAMSFLQAAAWPGNVRQLRNLIDRLAVFAPEGPITADVIAELGATRRADSRDGVLSELARDIILSEPVIGMNKLQRVEGALIDEALRLADGNKSKAARLLGVHRKVVERRLERVGVLGGP
jgi:DNA-binding NtrC family response regulator